MSFDERQFISRVTRANVDELARILSRPSPEEERALRVHLGDERYERMHQMALEQLAVSRSLVPSKGNVVVIHGIMGGELSNINSPSSKDLIWLSYWHLLRGWAERLSLNDDGTTGNYEIQATGIMKDYYGEVLMKLSSLNWHVEAFWFDWRKDLKIAADQLYQKIHEWFGDDSPVHLVAHSMGGLVTRAFIKKYPARWKAMWDAKNGGQMGGRLVMLGTPTYGSFIIPQVITGLEPVVRMLSFLDCPHGKTSILKIINTFPGSLQMLPSPFIMPKMEELYKADTFRNLFVAQHHLDGARNHHEWVRDVFDDQRMIYIAGYNRKTPSDILDMKKLDSSKAYDVTKLGDGRVTHRLGIPQNADGQPLHRIYYIDERHSDLLKNKTIIELMSGLLTTGATDKLITAVPSDVRALVAEDAATKDALRQELIAEQDAEVERFRQTIIRLKQVQRGPASEQIVTNDEQRLRESLTRGSISESDEGREVMTRLDQTSKPISIEVRLEWASIEEVGEENERGKKSSGKKELPVDAIAVGHYQGVGRPVMAELLLDQAISFELLKGKYKKPEEIPDTERLLTLYTDRGIIRGALGQPFFINDPRSRTGRVIALAGMGEPGRFGAPELVVLARELCWSLGRMRKRHLATVLIGSGQGNLNTNEAVAAWLRGLRAALTGSAHDKEFRLQRITFIEVDARKIKELQDAIQNFIEEEESAEHQLRIKYEPLDLETIKDKGGKTLVQRKAEIERKERAEFRKHQRQRDENLPQDDKKEWLSPTRLTLSLKGKKYRYGAITETASVPERDVPLDPSLVMEANDRIPNISDRDAQLEWGRFMENILLPRDLRDVFKTKAPIVMALDSTTAKIHWEMLAQPDPFATANQNETFTGQSSASDPFDSFLGTSRGLTRQLRTAFAPPPEPPPPPRRDLKVLVVADPWAERRLPGAMREGEEVANLFEAFNTVWNHKNYRVKVERLFGPDAATRYEVLLHLTRRGPYDILHYAGHCMYDNQEPSSSGWIFTGGERLSANELNRIDQIPKFVFSNACESGITPDRNWVMLGERTAQLAPSFAESFFARGVANFVCTAWYINDNAAREFALKLYGRLLGIAPIRSEEDKIIGFERDLKGPQKMHVAMHEARLAIAKSSYGAMTWGAYQHYGNPYLQFFDNESLKEPIEAEGMGASNSSSRKRSSKNSRAKSRANSKRARKGSSR